MTEIEAELRGRLVMLQTMVGVLLTQLARETPEPAATIQRVMANAEDLIEIAAHNAAGDDARAAEYTRAAFDELSDAIERHLLQHSQPSGRG